MRISTPELSNEEKVAFMNLQNKALTISMTPVDEDLEEKIEVSKDMDFKSPSQRQRAVLFILWKQDYENKYPIFSVFYEMTLNKFIDGIKLKINN